MTTEHRSWESAKEYQLKDLNKDSALGDQRGPEAHFGGGMVLSGCRGSSLVSLLRAEVGMPEPWKMVSVFVPFSLWFICRIEVWARLLWF